MCAVKVCFSQSVIRSELMKLLLGKLSIDIRRMILRQHSEEHHALAFKRGCMRRDDHALSQLCIARGLRVRSTVDLDEAHAATADRFKPPIMTERGNFDAHKSGGIKN